MVHLWTIPSLPQINLHKRNEGGGERMESDNHICPLLIMAWTCLLRCNVYIFAQIHNLCIDLLLGPWQCVDGLGRCIVRVWVQEFRQWELCVYMSAGESSSVCVKDSEQVLLSLQLWLPCLTRQLFKLDVCNSSTAQRDPWNWKYKWIKMQTTNCVSGSSHTHARLCGRIILTRPLVRSVCLLHASLALYL